MLHLLLAPGSGTDLSAQLARASFARAAPLTPIDLSWYSGLPVPSYSVLAPPLMALLGVSLAGLLAAVAGAVLLARLLRGSVRPLAGALSGAVVCVADVVDGRTTFALGAVAALAALVVLPRRRLAALLAVVTALLSPVAAVFLGLAAAVLVLHRRPGGWPLGIAAAVPVGALAVAFPTDGVQPFATASWVVAVLAGLSVAALCGPGLLRTGAVLYAVAVPLLVPFDDAFGSNVLRLALLLTVPLLLARATAPRPLLVVLVVAFTAWQAAPPYGDLTAGPGPALGALKAELVALDARRVEVVPPRDHREASDLVDRVVLARGWSRQVDRAENDLFYRGTLTAPTYLDWLRAHAVDLVAAPRTAAVDMGGRRERALLRAPVPGLTVVWQDRSWTVWQVDAPRPLVSPPAVVVSSGRTQLVLSSASPGTVTVEVRWSRWLSLSGSGCLAKDGDRVRVRFDRPGTLVLGSGLVPQGHC